MLRDIMRGEAQATAALDVIAAAGADVILLLDVDWDAEGRGAEAVRTALAERGADYPHIVARRPNSGVPSGLDLDGNGRLGEGRDALGYGRFSGDGGMVLLSRLPLGDVEDLSGMLWSERSDAPAELLPMGGPEIVPLATVAQWVVPLDPEGVGLTLVTMNATVPVFDGPEDRNGRRNADELGLVAELAGTVRRPVVLGRANVDPLDGEGLRPALTALLEHPALRDVRPRGSGGGGMGHAGDPTLDTAALEGPGPLRLDYVLPSRALGIAGSGVMWPPAEHDLAEMVEAAGRGRLVWVDVVVPAAGQGRGPPS